MSGVPVLGSLVGGAAKPRIVQAPPPPTPTRNADDLAAAAEAERRIRGRASTILTGGQGLLSGGTTASTVLLGS